MTTRSRDKVPGHSQHRTFFANVTQIEDAVSLWAKPKQQKASERWKPDAEEKYEDSSGNVVNKKTYEDLKC